METSEREQAYQDIKGESTLNTSFLRHSPKSMTTPMKFFAFPRFQVPQPFSFANIPCPFSSKSTD